MSEHAPKVTKMTVEGLEFFLKNSEPYHHRRSFHNYIINVGDALAATTASMEVSRLNKHG